MTALTVNSFLPPDTLIELVAQIGVINSTLKYTDYIATLPTPTLSIEGLNQEVVNEILTLQEKVRSDLGIAKKHSSNYFDVVHSQVLGVFDSLIGFAGGHDTHLLYKQIVDDYRLGESKKKAVIHGLSMISKDAIRHVAPLKLALGALANYNIASGHDQSKFKLDYQQEQKTLLDVTDVVKKLTKKIDGLQAQIGENNKKVTQTAIDEGIDLVKDGVSLAIDASKKDGEAGAVKTGALMGIKFMKETITIIVLEAETISMINEAAELTKKLNVVEHDLQVLNNIGSMLSSLTDGGTMSTDTLKSLDSYWQGLHEYTQSLIQDITADKPVEFADPDDVEKVWQSTIYNPLNSVLQAQLPTEEVNWNSGSYQFDSLDNINKYI